jgi:hypothetical protein
MHENVQPNLEMLFSLSQIRLISKIVKYSQYLSLIRTKKSEVNVYQLVENIDSVHLQTFTLSVGRRYFMFIVNFCFSEANNLFSHSKFHIFFPTLCIV